MNYFARVEVLDKDTEILMNRQESFFIKIFNIGEIDKHKRWNIDFESV